MATFGELITRTLTRLSALGGLDVQTYMQPKLAEMLQHKFDVLFDKRFWRDLTTNETMTLGNDGSPIGTVVNKIKRFSDIQYVWIPGYTSPLPEAPRSAPQSLVRQPSIAPVADPAKRFRVLPINTITSVEVAYRTKPAAFIETDVVPFDDQIMILGTCYDYLVGEAANMTDAQKFLTMYTDRLNTLEKLEMKNDKSFYPANTPSIGDWRDA